MFFPEKRSKDIFSNITEAVYSYEAALGTKPTILYVSPRLMDKIAHDGSWFYTEYESTGKFVLLKYMGLTVVLVDEWADELRFDVGAERRFV